MKKKAILALMMACALAMTACGKKEAKATEAPKTEEKTEEVKETKEKDDDALELSDDIYDFQVSIDGNVYQFPMKYADFTESGWDYTGDTEESIQPNAYGISEWFENGDNMTMAYLTNFDINAVSVGDCYLGGLMLESNYMEAEGTEVLMAKGIKLGESTQEDVKAAYGEPTSSYESDSFPTMTYESDIYSTIEFGFDAENGGVLNDIDIQNLVAPEDFEAGEVDDSVPAIVSEYEAPTEVGDDLLDYKISFAGDLYELPAPVSAFIDNGWTVVEDETETTIAGRDSGKVTLMKDNQTFWSYVRNYSENATSYTNCFITTVSANVNDCNVDLEAANGIKMGMSQADLEKALEGYTYEKEETSYVYYDVSDEESLTYGYEIIVRDGVVTGIDVQFDPSYDDYVD